MRNLKRVLSLALALVMMLGMMIITTSAAEATTKDFADADEIQYTEAADVLSALQVFEGDENSNFNPTKVLTREEAAAIICRMLMGPDNAKKLTGSAAFTDVAADRWSAGSIAYCANLGIIAGNGDGTVKIPRWLRAHSGKDIAIKTCSGTEFPDDLSPFKLVIHCGGCMLNEREVLYRMREAERQGVPFINYGLLIAHMQGIMARAIEVLDK